MRRVRQVGRGVAILVGLAALFAGAFLACRVHVATADQEAVRSAFGFESDESLLGDDSDGQDFFTLIFSGIPVEGRCGRPLMGAVRDGIAAGDVTVGDSAFNEKKVESFFADLGITDTEGVSSLLRSAASDACRHDARIRLGVSVGLLVLGLETLYIGVARPTLRRGREPAPSPPPPSPAPS